MSKQTKIFGIGASGLIGSRVAELLADSYPMTNLSSETGFDIRKSEMVDHMIGNDTEHPVVILFAAKTDVDGCEKDRETDQAILKKEKKEQEAFFRDNPTAWAINVFGTQNVVDACKKTHKKLIYISTDFVFDGSNPPEGGYKETDTISPVDWYGQTKWEGEEIVKNSGLPFLIIRPAFPYRSDVFPLKKDFVHIFLGLLEKKQAFQVVADALITPTFVDDFGRAMKVLLDKNAQGIYHIVGSQSLSAYEAVLLLADRFGFDKSLVGKNTAETFYKGRASRPFHSVINNDKIKELGVNMRTFEEGLKEIK